jgi:hypothetical protein
MRKPKGIGPSSHWIRLPHGLASRQYQRRLALWALGPRALRLALHLPVQSQRESVGSFPQRTEDSDRLTGRMMLKSRSTQEEWTDRRRFNRGKDFPVQQNRDPLRPSRIGRSHLYRWPATTDDQKSPSQTNFPVIRLPQALPINLCLDNMPVPLVRRFGQSQRKKVLRPPPTFSTGATSSVDPTCLPRRPSQKEGAARTIPSTDWIPLTTTWMKERWRSAETSSVLKAYDLPRF